MRLVGVAGRKNTAEVAAVKDKIRETNEQSESTFIKDATWDFVGGMQRGGHLTMELSPMPLYLTFRIQGQSQRSSLELQRG